MGSSRFIALVCAGALIAPALALRGHRPGPRPAVVLWAWERPVDLRGLPAGAGVAFLAQTITVSDAAHVISPRRQPLRVDPATYLVAVTRVEAPGTVPAQRDEIAAIAAAIARTRALPGVRGVQVDFDARVSQRPMYRQLLHDLRAALPGDVPLSMTALASWCLDDNWLDDLPVDEAVPMLFRMGPTEEMHRREFQSRLSAPACRRAIGLSLDERSGIHVFRGTRLYVFNPGPWTSDTVRVAAQEAER